jgi:class 3 adenylate cyclase
MNCPQCGIEPPANSAFCNGCGTSLVVVCPGCGATPPPNSSFCNGCGAPLRTEPARGPTERAPRDYTPKHLADKILQSKSALEGERKQVTVMFADVKGSMELAEQLGPEEWHRVLERFFEILAEGVHRFEGTINQYTGDGIMALFGAPIAHEDHAQRACYTALWLQEELQSWAREIKREHGLGIPTRLGLHSGEVVVGRIGDDLRMDYTAQGHAVGLAQRMEALAEPNTCYLSDTTASLVSGYFEVDDLGPFTVKGAPDPIHVFELRGHGALKTRLDVSQQRGLSQFVGRDVDMQSLESALEQAQSGNGQVVGIVAEAGTGKSRLCFEFLERCRAKGLQVLEGSAVAHGKNIPLLPILQAFRGYYGIVEQDDDRTVREKIAGRLLLLDPGFAEHLPVQFEFFGVPDPERPVPVMDPEAKQSQIFTVMRRVIQGTGPDDLIVTLIEDLHWMDPVSETFLEQLVDAVSGSNFLLLVNFRPEYRAQWTSRAYYRQIPLAPLGPEAVRELLDHLLGDDASTLGLADSIHKRTGGNPFFTEEVIQSLIESQHLEGTRGNYRLVSPIETLAVPSTVQALLAARMDRLAEREKEILQAAAVIGKEFPESILMAASGLPEGEIRESLGALRAAEFIYELAIYPAVEYAFKHPLTQEVALGTQLKDRQRRTHAAVARAIEEANADHLESNAALLAHHWEESGDGPRAARWYAMAAAASGVNDVGAALSHWQRARVLAGPDQTDLAVTAASQVLALSWRQGVSEEDGQRLFDEARAQAEEAGELRPLASLIANYGGLRGIAHGHTRDYMRYSVEAARIADEIGDLSLRCGTRAYVIYSYLHGGLLGPALSVCDELEELVAGDVHCGADVAGFSPLIGVMHVRASMHGYRGDPIDIRSIFGAAEQAARDHDYPEMAVWIPWVQVLQAEKRRDTDNVMVWARESLELAGDQRGLTGVMSRITHARALGIDGQAQAQLDLANETLRMIREDRDSASTEPDALDLIALAHLRLDNPIEARTAAAEAIALVVARQTYGFGIWAYGTLARAQLAIGEATEQIEQTLDDYAVAIEHTGMHLFDAEVAELRAVVQNRSRSTQ